MTRSTLLWVFIAALPLAACGGDDGKGKPFKATGGSGGTSGGGSGGTSGGGTSGGGTSGGGGTGNSGGLAGGGGVAGGGGTGNVGGGGTSGVGGTGATGPEVCTDGVDNDQNGQIDCGDVACKSSCGSACAGPTVLTDPSSAQGSTYSHKDSLDNSCTTTPGASDLAFEVTAKNSGVFEAIIGGFTPLTLSARSASCSGAELGCTKGKSLKLNVTAGTKLWLVVDGATTADAGPFGLSVESRAITCGDKHTDGTEACDDGNTTSGDGCTSTCAIEFKESEPNDVTGQANTWADPFAAAIGSAGDVDVIKVTVTKAGGKLSASVVDFGDSACEQDKIDSYMELLDTDGATLLGTDDNGGEGLCSAIGKANLAIGTYYLVISAAPGANPATFAYKVSVTLS